MVRVVSCFLVLGVWLTACEAGPENALVGQDSGLELAAAGPMASGSGHFDFLDGRRVFTFNASERQSGFGGRFLVQRQTIEGHRIHGDVHCFTIAPDGKTAWLGGIVTRANVPGWDVGDFVGWTARDNGEGHDNPPDVISLVHNLGPDEGLVRLHCAQGLIAPTFTVEQGNIQVRP